MEMGECSKARSTAMFTILGSSAPWRLKMFARSQGMKEYTFLRDPVKERLSFTAEAVSLHSEPELAQRRSAAPQECSSSAQRMPHNPSWRSPPEPSHDRWHHCASRSPHSIDSEL